MQGKEQNYRISWRLTTNGRPFHSENHSGFLKLTEVQFPNPMLGMKLKGGGAANATTGITLDRCFIPEGGNLEMATSGTLTATNNNFGKSSLMLYNNSTTVINENKWLDAVTALYFRGVNNNTTVRCNSFSITLPPQMQSDHVGIAIAAQAQVNLNNNRHRIGSLLTTDVRAGNYFAINIPLAAVAVIKTTADARTIVSPTNTYNGATYNFRALYNQSVIDLDYHAFGNEFVGSTLGNITITGQFPTITNRTFDNSISCLNTSVAFPPLLRRGNPNALDNFISSTIKVFPIPATSLVTIESDEQISEITILNTLGQVVESRSNLDVSAFTVDVAQISAGVYTTVVKLHSGLVATRKIIKQ